MGVREEYEYLKTELLIRLTDATVMSNLDFPFDITIDLEDEKKFFMRGLKTRLVLKKTLIMLDNCYQKIRLFPSDESADLFIESRDGILEDFRKDVEKAFLSDQWRIFDFTLEDLLEYSDNLISKIKDGTKPYIESLKKLKAEDIEKEIKTKEHVLELSKERPLKKNK